MIKLFKGVYVLWLLESGVYPFIYIVTTINMYEEFVRFAERLTVELPVEQEMLPWERYKIHCNFSGKDSIALVLLLLYGYKVPKEKMELVHFRVDGSEENPANFDWPQTDQYLR